MLRGPEARMGHRGKPASRRHAASSVPGAAAELLCWASLSRAPVHRRQAAADAERREAEHRLSRQMLARLALRAWRSAAGQLREERLRQKLASCRVGLSFQRRLATPPRRAVPQPPPAHGSGNAGEAGGGALVQVGWAVLLCSHVSLETNRIQVVVFGMQRRTSVGWVVLVRWMQRHCTRGEGGICHLAAVCGGSLAAHAVARVARWGGSHPPAAACRAALCHCWLHASGTGTTWCGGIALLDPP
jgi:hypothetical protein